MKALLILTVLFAACSVNGKIRIVSDSTVTRIDSNAVRVNNGDTVRYARHYAKYETTPKHFAPLYALIGSIILVAVIIIFRK